MQISTCNTLLGQLHQQSQLSVPKLSKRCTSGHRVSPRPVRATAQNRHKPDSAESPVRGKAQQVTHSLDAKTNRRALLASACAAGAWSGLQSSLAEASVFTGEYFDSNHPGCPRSIDAAGMLTGLDPDPFVPGQGFGKKEGEPGTCYANGSKSGGSGKPTMPWKIQTKISADDETIFIDFDQKDGSGESFTCKWTGTGILLPDGKEWTKLK